MCGCVYIYIDMNDDLFLSEGLGTRIDKVNQLSESVEEAVKEALDYAINVDGLEPRQALKVIYLNWRYRQIRASG